jgi:uncharacterized protein YndB with AHSA1/START domain
VSGVADVEVSRTIAASPEDVYERVSDVTRMGEWSPETTRCRWVGGATGPVAGARFRGANRSGWRRWSTTCTVVEAEPGRRFAFDVTVGPFRISRWAYEMEPTDGGCRVTESWTDHRAGWMAAASGVVVGVRDRAAHNRAGMERTLAALAAAAEG